MRPQLAISTLRAARPALTTVLAAALAAALAASAGGCANLLGIEELSEGRADGGADPDAPGPDGALEPDAPVGSIRVGFPDQFAGEANLTVGFVWAIDIRITQPVTVDRLGIIALDGTAVQAHVGLYTGTDIRPTSIITQSSFVPITTGPNEVDVPDADLLPGVYWVAATFEEDVNVGGGLDPDPDVTLHFATHSFLVPLPDAFPSSNGSPTNAINFYMVLAP